MRACAALRSLLMCVAYVSVGLTFAPASAFAEGSSGLGGSGASPLESSLVVPGAQVLLGGEGVRDVEEARLSSPEAVTAREESRTKFENLSSEQAEKADGEAFPGMFDEPAGGPPKLPAGESIVDYPADDAAQIELGEGKHGVLASTEPLAVEASPDHRTPVELGLVEAGGMFEPKTPVVGVRIPKQLGEGVKLEGTGVSLTPVNPNGSALGGSEGVVDGVSVIYGNTLTDADTAIKPTTLGFEADTLLRSVESPQQISFRVGLPEGASLVAAPNGSGAVGAMDEGQTIASIRPPSAVDAAGARVPVSMTVSGDTLVLSVDDPPGEYQYPIEVDPEVEDKVIGGQYETNWKSESNDEFYRYYNLEGGKWEANIQGWRPEKWVGMFYETGGKSHITSFYSETSAADPSSLENRLGILNSSKSWEGKVEPALPSSYGATSHTVSATGSSDENVAAFEQNAITEDVKDEEGHDYLYKATVTISQTEGPSVSFNTTSPTTKSGHPNVLYTNGWINPHAGEFEINASDPGVGISGWHFSAPGWSEEVNRLTEEGACAGVQCETQFSEDYSGEKLPNGEDTIEAKVSDAVGLNTTASAKVKVDTASPYDIKLGSSDEVGEGEYTLRVEATDGSGSTPSSGLKSVALAIDGREVGGSGGSCSPGPCTAAHSVAINGDELGVGEHKVTVVATDNAGNVASETLTFKVHHDTPVSVGPGAVDPQSGEFSLGATDVSVGAPGSSLKVSRHYGSRHLTAGSEGPLGPQWSLSVGGQESITKLSNGSVTLTAANEGQSTFTSAGGEKFTPPPGDANLTLSEVKNEKGELTEYVLKDAADSATTRFTSTSGPTGSLWKPTKQEGPLASQTVRYSYGAVEGVTRPLEALAPEPAGVSCGSEPKELKAGCRALTFKYAEGTTAKGEGSSEWGEYKGRLSEIVFHVYSPAAKAMEEVSVAEYSYDKLGRLRAEWNPQVSPALKTTYGYDAEGHVTALTAPGQESWAFTYGVIAGDSNTGRLLKVTQAPASAGLWDGQVPVNTAVPKVSGSAVPGSVLGVSTGTWSNGPVAYAYQWEDCNKASGGSCTPIAGATNPNYTVRKSDTEEYVVAVVSAINGGGSVAASSVGVGPVESFESAGYSPLGGGEPGGIVAGPEKEKAMWFADYSASKIEKITTAGTLTEYPLPAGSEPWGIVMGPEKEKALWFTDYGTSKIGKITTSGTITEYSLPEKGFYPKGIALGADGNLWFADSGDKVGKITPSGTITEYLLKEITLSDDLLDGIIAAGPEKEKALWLTVSTDSGRDDGQGKVVKITTSGTISSEYNLPEYSLFPEGISTGPEKENALWITLHNNSQIEKITTSGTVTEYMLPKESYPKGIAAGPEGDMWFAESGAAKIGKITPSGKVTEYSTYGDSDPDEIAEAPETATEKGVWYTTSSKVDKRIEFGPTNGEQYAPGPGWTIEYKVPTSGTGLPLNEEEIGKWGQKDYPVEGMAIFPPDEPQGWPASGYKRATIDYLDEKGRTVNVYSPTGGISTTEYNAYDDVTRTLSPDNRAAALKEGSKSSEVSKLLDSESVYEETGSEPGTRLLETLGPQHTVKLAKGKEKTDEEALARDHVKYYYDEGAPSEGGPYDLATKQTDGALTTSKEEFDVRETTTSYSGQENLGWKLRKPTSVTTDPNGLKLTHTVLYEASTGEVSETRMPANSKEKSPHATEGIYYTTAANSKYPACGEHPEWAGLACQAQPAKQPETSGLPGLPVATVTYNIWDEPAKTTETVGSATRTDTATYDAAGRLKTSAISSTVGTALPTVTDEYNKETGALEKQCANEGKPCTEGKPKTITSVYNTLGQLTSYTDADENTATYEYEKEKDYRLIKASDGKGTQTYTYNETTGLLSELVDSSHEGMKFTATYDVEGNMLTEGYPNGMTATSTYNPTGEPTALEYKKTTHCTENCTWFGDIVVPSIHGQWLEQTGTLSHQVYTYDAAGRLTQVQNTPAGGKCTTRIYAYETDTNRTSLTTDEPNSKGECATEKGTEEKHTYDEADRLTDTGVKYNEFGDITALPPKDAGGKEPSEELTSTYYTDNQLDTQTQNGETIGYNFDPAGRTRETVSTGKTTQDIIDHYAAGGDSPAWTIETPSGNWTRNIQGIGSGLAAIQVNGATPVLQLTDLHGDIIGTAALSETETKLLTMTDTSEYGVPTTSAPAKYSWLGAEQQPTELASGVIAMGARSYVPELGRFLQPDPRPGGSANAYSYTFGDPVDTSDPSGEYSGVAISGWVFEFLDQEAHAAAVAAAEAIRRAAEEAAAREAAERQRAAAILAAAAAGPQTSLWSSGGPEEPLGGSEGWACEYAAETGQEGEGCGGEVDFGLIIAINESGAAGHGTPAPRGGKGGSPNEGSTGPCRSGGPVVKGKCQKGADHGSNGSAEVCAGFGGLIGGGIGTALGGPLGGALGGGAGGEAGAKACGG